jgi:Na+/glutamate symporter
MGNEATTGSQIKLIVIVVLVAIVAAVAATLIQHALFGKAYTVATGGIIGGVVGATYVGLRKKYSGS